MSKTPDILQSVFDGLFAGISRGRETYAAQLTPRETGTITSVSTGIARVSGLPGVGFDELVKFPGGMFGIAFNVDEDEIGVVLLGEYWHLHAGDEVERTGRVLDVVVGDGLALDGALVGRYNGGLRPRSNGGRVQSNVRSTQSDEGRDKEEARPGVGGVWGLGGAVAGPGSG